MLGQKPKVSFLEVGWLCTLPRTPLTFHFLYTSCGIQNSIFYHRYQPISSWRGRTKTTKFGSLNLNYYRVTHKEWDYNDSLKLFKEIDLWV